MYIFLIFLVVNIQTKYKCNLLLKLLNLIFTGGGGSTTSAPATTTTTRGDCTNAGGDAKCNQWANIGFCRHEIVPLKSFMSTNCCKACK